ncbi:hypothetical protein B0A55_11232 [Friedmanniomyces simplex]|uniref:Uncharacterized protein n=1 Tax=Friedmanniomyces simplex TaxID=329884 RepID=A0A4U0WJ13_9PEZI|nr:hypothetical protein B0A55_11232 [Friedmanniomyces simplex]
MASHHNFRAVPSQECTDSQGRVTLPSLSQLDLGLYARRHDSLQPTSPFSTIQNQRHHDLQMYSPSIVTTDVSRSATPASSRGSSAAPEPPKKKPNRTRGKSDEAKKRNERIARKSHSNVHCDMEDAIALYIGYVPEKEQKASNGASAGLRGDKLENENVQGMLLNHFLQQCLEPAFLHDQAANPNTAFEDGPAVKAVRAELGRVIQAGKRGGNVLSGCWLDDGADINATRCARLDDGSRACRLHPSSADYRLCRLSRRKKTFEANLPYRSERQRVDREALVRRLRGARLA